MGRIEKFTTQELREYKFSKEWLIEHWVHVGDCVFFKAQKKVGKSIFAQVISFCASYGGLFLGEYNIVKPMKVAYMFSEGAVTDWKDRVINMSKMHNINEDNITWVQCSQLQIHTEIGGRELFERLVSYDIDFDIIVWDCFYKFLFAGDYNNNVDVGVFNANEETIRNHFNAASIIIHHDSEKKGRTKDGKEYSAASKDNAMGSTAILANATQCYTMERLDKKTKKNRIVLGDFRGGDLVPELIYYNVVPEDNDRGALGIKLDDKDVNSNRYMVTEYIKGKGEVRQRGLLDSITDLDCSSETLRRICRRLEKEKLIKQGYNESGAKVYQWISVS